MLKPERAGRLGRSRFATRKNGRYAACAYDGGGGSVARTPVHNRLDVRVVPSTDGESAPPPMGTAARPF
jgi:hypothetical protein